MHAVDQIRVYFNDADLAEGEDRNEEKVLNYLQSKYKNLVILHKYQVEVTCFVFVFRYELA